MIYNSPQVPLTVEYFRYRTWCSLWVSLHQVWLKAILSLVQLRAIDTSNCRHRQQCIPECLHSLIKKPQVIGGDNFLLLGIAKFCTCTAANTIDRDTSDKDRCDQSLQLSQWQTNKKQLDFLRRERERERQKARKYLWKSLNEIKEKSLK